jgi:hypothetical protein
VPLFPLAVFFLLPFFPLALFTADRKQIGILGGGVSFVGQDYCTTILA